MKASDVMSSSVAAVREDAPLAQALDLMLRNHISGLPVLDAGGRPVGMLTEGDLLQRAEIGTEGSKPGRLRLLLSPNRLAGDFVRTHGRKVGEVMTSDVETVDEDATLEEVVERMRARRVKRLPVTRDGVMVGIVSRADLMRALAQGLAGAGEGHGDAAIREEIMNAMAAQPWSMHRTITVSVVNGAVALDGVVFDLRQRDAAQVMAENAAGVKSVQNRLVCVDAMSGMVLLDPAEERDASAYVK
jgi:CBS domain-containing protein